MLNPFYWYGVLWSAILILYCFRWSDLCKSVDSFLIIFYIASILVSFLLGRVFHSFFTYDRDSVAFEMRRRENHFHGYTLLFGFLYCMNFLYARDIPLLSSVFGNKVSYLSFEGIPTLGVFITTATLFYGVFLIYHFTATKSKVILKQMLAICMLFVLQLNRNALMLLSMAFVIFYICNNGKSIFRKGSGNGKYIVAGVIGIVSLFAMGVLGNVRHKYEWYDSSYICTLAEINDNYPVWLPKQFVWAYIYLVSPMLNLNYNIVNRYCEPNVTNYLLNYLPDFIEKRLPDNYYASVELLLPNFNVSTTYATFFKYGDKLGMIVAQAAFVLGMVVVALLSKWCRRNQWERNLLLLFEIYFIVMTFFDNVFRYTGTILPVYYAVFVVCWSKLGILMPKLQITRFRLTSIKLPKIKLKS